jgi:hypothetical protein
VSRRAALPAPGYQPPPRLIERDGQLVVRFYPEGGGQAHEFDLNTMPVAEPLRRTLAEAFATVTGPAGTRRTRVSATGVLQDLRLFATVLAEATRPLCTVAELTPAHADAFRLRCGATYARRVSSLKTLFRAVPEVPAAFAARLHAPPGRRPSSRTVDAYSKAEFARITAAARDDVRSATRRVRRTRQFLRQWRDGSIDPVAHAAAWRRGQVLDHVDRHADVPRTPRGRSSVRDVGDVAALVSSLHVTQREIGAFVVLLSCLTGQNPSILQGLPVAHHRADGGLDTATGTALVDVVKPRRGRYRAHMTIPLADLPVWLDPPTGTVELGARDQLRTPFGVYTLALELTEASRMVLGTDRLLVYWSVTSGRGGGLRTAGDELIPIWGRSHPVAADTGEGTVLVLDGRRLRRSFVEIHQKPVAHTDQTLASSYLRRNRRSLADYQKVVAQVLAEQVTRARATTLARTLTPSDVAAAQADPQQVADRFGIDVPTLKRLLAGELDTVLAGCVDHTNSPHTQAGQPCTASFMLCLSCPCARAEPRHLPVQVLTLDALELRRADLPPLRWAQRFAAPHAQLGDLLSQFPTAAIDGARRDATDEQRQLVHRFLNRELDLP